MLVGSSQRLFPIKLYASKLSSWPSISGWKTIRTRNKPWQPRLISSNPTSLWRAALAMDGQMKIMHATATCFCCAVQLSFPVQGPGLVGKFVCHCTECREITASMFASNFTVDDGYLTRIRGREKLTAVAQSHTIASGQEMTNYFCSVCGTLMYRVGKVFPGKSILRIGTVDDFNLHETKLKPQREIFAKDRVSWMTPIESAAQIQTQRARI